MQQLISFLTTENKFFCDILTLFFGALEMMLLLYLTKTLFNLTFTFSKFRFFKVITFSTIIFTIAKATLPLPFNLLPNFITFILFTAYYCKISLLKSTLSSSIFICSMALLEYLINLVVTKLFKFNLVDFSLVPINKILSTFVLSFLIYIIIFLLKSFNIKFNISSENTNKDNFKFIAIIILTLLIILPNFIFITLLEMNLPTIYVIYNILSAFVFFLVGLYSTNRLNKLQITKRELQTANLYNSTLSKLVDSNRSFRHDINNIVNSIGGFIELNDMNGLKKYYSSGLLPEIQKSNNLSLLNPDIINSPPLFGLLLAKYNYADSLGVKIELNSFFDYSTINMNIFDFVKIFGIFLDNAIEAASLCNDKLVSIHITIDFYNRKQIFKISNTYLSKDIDINKIFDKDFSTKEIKSGFGLWEVKQLLKKTQNAKLITSKDVNFFTQKLEIYF